MQYIQNALAKRGDEDEGFTLIELLVVVIIIGILAAIAIPVFLNQREKAWDSAAKSDIRNAQTAMETYFTDNTAYTGTVDPDLTDVGFSESENVQHAACVFDASGGTDNAYAVFASHTQSSTVWMFDSSTGNLTEAADLTGPCDAAVTLG